MRVLLASLLLALPSPLSAQPAVQTVVSAVGEAGADGIVPVELTILNPGDAARDVQSPSRVPGEVSVGETRTSVTLERLDGTAESVTIAPGGFAKLRYGLRPPVAGTAGTTAILCVTDWGGNGIAFRLPAATALAASAAPVVRQSFETADDDTGNAFLRGLSAYEPIYGVIGSGTDTVARLQFSLKYQLFGEDGALRGAPKLLDGLYFGFTQRMFWDLRRKSSPLRNVDYMPELFYLMPGKAIFDGVSVGGQAGFRHESNGREGVESRSFNTVYAQPVVTMPVGQYRVSLGPRLSLYVGRRSENPDIADYRGHASLFAEIGRDDGLRLSTNSRYNFSTGRGAVNAELSYPLTELIARNLNLYLMGQVFTGYGENLLDYRRNVTRARIGLAIVR